MAERHAISFVPTRLSGKSSESESTFDEEVALARAYLDIEQMRFLDRLSIFFEIAPGMELALLPVLLLQPLVETPSTTA